MALGTITVTNDLRKSASAPLGCVELSFAGDGAYPSGGTPDFEAEVQAVVGREIDLLFVVKVAASGVYTAIYDKANDKLYVENAAATEASGSLSGTTFKLMAFYQ
jgi:hypothetical protein